MDNKLEIVDEMAKEIIATKKTNVKNAKHEIIMDLVICIFSNFAIVNEVLNNI